jgi:hypothetical protein
LLDDCFISTQNVISPQRHLGSEHLIFLEEEREREMEGEGDGGRRRETERNKK